MGTKQCKSCKSEVPKGAKKCSECKSDLRNWFAKHWFITGFIVLFFIWTIMSWLEDAEENKNNPIDTYWETLIEEPKESISAENIDEILISKYKDYFDSEWLNIELKNKILDEQLWNDIALLRSSFFTSDNKTQILVNTIYTLDWVEYASNSKHNIETNLIEEFYSNEIK